MIKNCCLAALLVGVLLVTGCSKPAETVAPTPEASVGPDGVQAGVAAPKGLSVADQDRLEGK